MDNILRLVNWLEGFLIGGGTLVQWFVTPISNHFKLGAVGGLGITDALLSLFGALLNFTPLELLGITGLTTFILFAIGKWILA